MERKKSVCVGRARLDEDTNPEPFVANILITAIDGTYRYNFTCCAESFAEVRSFTLPFPLPLIRLSPFVAFIAINL
jgi:hypothetical protein